MPFARLLGTLAVLAVLGACQNPNTSQGNAPQLPDRELLETTVGAPFEVSFAATGGTPPLQYSMDHPPPGCTFHSSEGVLEGPVTVAGQYTFSVWVKDATGTVDSRAYTLLVQLASRDGGTETDAGTDAGTGLAFSAANWNLEWFGSPDAGPSNEPLQLANVQQVISKTGADFWGLEELVDATQFAALKQQLPGYDGFMANDSRVSGGAYYYSPSEQKVGILYRSDVVTVLDQRLILTSNDYDFGSRPPLRVDLRITRNGTSVDLVAIVLHMKAFSDTSSYSRRQSAAVALKNYLDTNLPDQRFIVLGDWNDDVDVSITKDPSATNSFLPTPYQDFVNDPADYTFVTRPLSLAGQRSTVSYGQFIDHQLVSNGLFTSYVSNSAEVLQPDTYISQYRTTTTDHYPVRSRYAFDVMPPPPPGSALPLTSP